MRELKSLLLFMMLLSAMPWAGAQTWTQKADYGSTARNRAAAFSIPYLQKFYVVGGYDFTYQQDVWEYDTLTDAWTQRAAFPGGSTTAVAFSINGKGYVGTGVGGGFTWTNSFYEYDPLSDSWTQKADFPGAARGYAFGFAIGDKGYIGGGFSGLPGSFIAYSDLYEYDPATDSWTQKAGYPGAGGALGAVGFAAGVKGYAGCGSSIDVQGNQTLHDDFWEYDPVTDAWTQKADYAGGIRGEATAFAVCSKGYIGLGYNVPHASFNNDFWEYDPASDTWIAINDFGGVPRAYAPGAAIGKSGYAATGSNGITNFNDHWEYHIIYSAALTLSDDSVCEGGSISFTDASDFSATGWNWIFPGGMPSISSDQSPVISYDLPGIYDATLIAYNECDTAEITITEAVTVLAIPPPPELGNDTLFCGPFSWQLNAGSSGFDYAWSTGDTTSSIVVSEAGTFFVTVTNQCSTQSDTVTILQDQLPSMTVSNDTSVCEVNQLELSASITSGAIEWSTGETSATIFIDDPGTYWASVYNACGSDTDQVSVTLIIPPSAYLGSDTALCDFENFILDGGEHADSYLWSDGSTDTALAVQKPGLYWVQATNECNSASDSVLIEPCEADVLMPNAFSPNGDGMNDLLSPILIGNAALLDLRIYNRWGELIFQTVDASAGWNGEYQGEEEDIGVFVFTLKFMDEKNGLLHSRAGNITLLR